METSIKAQMCFCMQMFPNYDVFYLIEFITKLILGNCMQSYS
jgi:hypothetical protein